MLEVPEGSEFSILDIGCGQNANFLSDLENDDEIKRLREERGITLKMYGISADDQPKPTFITHYNKFLNSKNGLNFIDDNVKFDFIISSWCMNYLGPSTFDKTIRNSVKMLKEKGKIRIHPFSPVSPSPAFPHALSPNFWFKHLFNNNDNNIYDIKNRMIILSRLYKIPLPELTDDLQSLKKIYTDHFDNNIVELVNAREVWEPYSQKIHNLKVHKLKEFFIENPQLVHSRSSSGILEIEKI